MVDVVPMVTVFDLLEYLKILLNGICVSQQYLNQP